MNWNGFRCLIFSAWVLPSMLLTWYPVRSFLCRKLVSASVWSFGIHFLSFTWLTQLFLFALKLPYTAFLSGNDYSPLQIVVQALAFLPFYSPGGCRSGHHSVSLCARSRTPFSACSNTALFSNFLGCGYAGIPGWGFLLCNRSNFGSFHLCSGYFEGWVVFELPVALLGLDEYWLFSFSARPAVSGSSVTDFATQADTAGDLVVVIPFVLL